MTPTRGLREAGGCVLSIYDEPKIDCHNHVFDPVRFPYAPQAYYKFHGQEIGTAAQLLAVFDAYGVQTRWSSDRTPAMT